MGLHSVLVGADIHVVHTYTYADQTARLAATGFVAGDVGKVASQTSDKTLWALVGISPTVWSELTTPAASIFGTDFQQSSSSGSSSTTSSTPQDKLSITTSAFTGVYRVAFYAEVAVGATNRTCAVRLYNSTDAAVLCDIQHKDPAADTYFGGSGFAYVTFAGAAKTIKVQYSSPDNAATVTIRNAKIELWKVSA